MTFRNRPLARLGAAALLAFGVVAGLGVPAQAAGTATDLSLDVVGTRVADGASGKILLAKVTNKGENTPSELGVRIDVSKVDRSKVAVTPRFADEFCDSEGGDTPTSFTCWATKEGLPGPGEHISLDLAAVKLVKPLDEAYNAPVSVTLLSKDDTNEDNNSKSVNIEFTKERGADLSVWANDVKKAVRVKNGEVQIVGDLHAGDTAELGYGVWNQGDMAIAGFKSTIKLPKGVTFATSDGGCEYDAAKTSAVCTWAVRWRPQDECYWDPDLFCGGEVRQLLSVNAAVKPGAHTGGSVTVEPIMPGDSLGTQAEKTLSQPKNVTQLHAVDVDPSDNHDSFAVIVAAKGAGGGGGGGGGGADDGGLPVTGAKASLIGGIGAAVLVAGAAMYLVARRRRVVLVSPDDEKGIA